MNRQPKFRVFENGVMHYPKSLQSIRIFSDGSGYLIDSDPDNTVIASFTPAWLQKGGKLLNCTLINDKEGAEIHEGDVVEYNNRKWVIRYGAWCWMMADVKDNDNCYAFDYPTAKMSKVIGNIYEHPHLLSQNS